MSCVHGGRMALPSCSHGRLHSTLQISIDAATRSADCDTLPLQENDQVVAVHDNVLFEPGTHHRLLRLPEVMRRVGLKRSAIYQRMVEGRFPKSRSLGAKCTVWVESEIDDWIRAVASTG